MCRLPVGQRVALKVMGRFLVREDLEELTGYKKPALQRRWLAENGYNFDVRADGKPVVSIAHYESCHSPRTRNRASVPDLDAVDRLL